MHFYTCINEIIVIEWTYKTSAHDFVQIPQVLKVLTAEVERHLAGVFKERLQLSGVQQGLRDKLHYQDLRPVHGISGNMKENFIEFTLELLGILF